MRESVNYYLTTVLFTLCSVITNGKTISPINFGILEAESPLERFEILLQTHLAAIENNAEIDYSNIDSLSIEIPSNAHPIPLPKRCDFKSLKLYVLNREKNIVLFERKNKLIPISISKKDFIENNFKSYSELRNGLKLLTITDKTPWVSERQGYGYPFFRKDLLLMDNGVPINSTIMSYTDSLSEPIFSYCDVDSSTTIISNLFLYREKESCFKTFCLCVENTNNVVISDIHIFTPESNLHGDKALSFINCSNILCENISIDGTYSQADKYGYGISMNNVYNSCFSNVKSKSLWGVFGNNNINIASLINCDINRFDVHCYGKDIKCSNSIFRDLYNQFSSMTGIVVFEKCTFNNFVPILLEDSYHAYTLFYVMISDCCINVDSSRPYLIDLRKAIPHKYARRELADVFWPNLFLNKTSINISDSSKYYTLYRSLSERVPNTSQEIFIDLSDVNLSNDITKVRICNIKVDSNYLSLTIKNLHGIFQTNK